MESDTEKAPNERLQGDGYIGKMPENRVGTDKPSPQCINAMWAEFQQTTTMHGVSRTQPRGRHIIRRYLWTVIVLGMVGGLVYSISNLLTEYFKYKTIVNIKMENKGHVPFPAVTICNLSPYNKTKMNYTPALQNYLLKIGPLSNYSEDIDWNNPDYVNFTVPRTPKDFEEFSFTMNQSLVICIYERQRFACDERFVVRTTNSGLCYTFNSHGSLVTYYTGSNNGLVVVFYVDQGNYILSMNLAAGIKVGLHDPGDEPDMENEGFLASPGFSTYAAISYKQYTYLPAPYAAFGDKYCVDTESADFVNPLKYYKKYTFFTCMFECKVEVVVGKCNCRLANDPGNATICSYKDSLECYAPIMYKFDVDTELQKACNCGHPCRKVEYRAKLSAAFYPNQETEKFLSRYNMTNLRKDMVELRVYFDTLSMKNYAHVPEYTFNSIIGTLGGQFGIFIGASLLTMSEILELCFAILLVSLKRLLRGIKVKPNS